MLISKSMHLRTAALACLFIWSSLLIPTARTLVQHGTPTSNGVYNQNQTDVLCRPFGRCEPCPEDSLHEPFCQPFGNRRLMHCSNATVASPSHTYYDSPTPSPSPTMGETPAWQSCGRIVEQERADFYEFFLCNLAFAVLALGVLAARSKRLQARQAMMLATRIGLVRSTENG